MSRWKEISLPKDIQRETLERANLSPHLRAVNGWRFIKEQRIPLHN